MRMFFATKQGNGTVGRGNWKTRKAVVLFVWLVKMGVKLREKMTNVGVREEPVRLMSLSERKQNQCTKGGAGHRRSWGQFINSDNPLSHEEPLKFTE